MAQAKAQAKLHNKCKPAAANPPKEIIKAEAVGQTIPTPQNIPAARKPSLVTSKLASGELL